MDKFLKVGVFALLAVIFILFGLAVYMRISYEFVSKQLCSETVAIEEVTKKIAETNTSTEPFIVLRLKEKEVESLLNSLSTGNGTSFCLKIANAQNISILARKNPFIWAQLELMPIEQKPFISITKIHWNGMAIPGYLESNANNQLLDAFNKYFETTALSSRYFDRLEVDGDTFLIYSSVKK